MIVGRSAEQPLLRAGCAYLANDADALVAPFVLAGRGPTPPSGTDTESIERTATGRRQPTVLVVDDDHGIRTALAMVLEDEGLRCTTAANGAEALELLRSGVRPDLIILDLMMPVMSGFEFRAAQRADPALAAIPTVVLSAAGEPSSRLRELGVEVFRKPPDLTQLLEIIDRHLAGRSGGV